MKKTNKIDKAVLLRRDRDRDREKYIQDYEKDMAAEITSIKESFH